MSVPQGDFPTAWHGGYGNAASARRLSPRRSQSPRPHTPSSQSGPSQPAGYSGYRSKEGYTGYRPERGTSNIRTSNDQNRSSEGLQQHVATFSMDAAKLLEFRSIKLHLAC